MNKITYFVLLISLFVVSGCNKSPEEVENTVDPKELQNFYKEYDLKFVSRLNYFADDQLNYSEVKLVNMAERNSNINFTAETFYATVGIYTGEVVDNEFDLATEAMTVAETNIFINLRFNRNPYTSKTEWDYNKDGKLNIITYLSSNSFFPDYFGGDFGGYYNATDGYPMFSFKSYPSSLKGYMREVNGRMIFVDMYRYKAYFENVRDSSWRELPLTVGSHALSFDFETVGSDYGIVATTLANELNVFTINDTTTNNFASIETQANTQFAGWDGAYTVAVYKNGTDKNKPYVAIRRNSTVDIYQYDVKTSKITSVYSKLPLPTEMHFSNNQTFGNGDYYYNFYFSSNLVLLQTGTRFYWLQGNEFVEYLPGLPLEKAITITCAESGEEGIYFGLSVKLESGKRVADIVLFE